MIYCSTLNVGGKLGFYYKDHEILPPLPGRCIGICSIGAPCIYKGSKRETTRFVHAVGFHRYMVENLDDASSDNLTEREVAEFDPPSEVCKKIYLSVYQIVWQANGCVFIIPHL
jgi:xylulokinase